MIAGRFLLIIYCLNVFGIKNSINTNFSDHEYKVSELADIEFNFNKNNFNDDYFFGEVHIIAKKYNQEKFNLSMGIYNENGSYTYENDESLKSMYKLSFKNYYFKFNIPKYEISDNFRIKFEYNIEINTLDYFFIDFTSDSISSSLSNVRVVESVICKDNKVSYDFLNFNFNSVINVFNFEYYNFLDFKKIKVKIDNLKSLDGVNFKIYDKGKIFKDILDYDSNWCSLSLNGEYIEGVLNTFNNKKFYLETSNFLLSNIKNDFYNLEVTELYFPNNYYEYFNNQDVQLILKNINERFDFIFEYNISFTFKERNEKNTIIQENRVFLDCLNYEEVYL